MEEIFPSVRKNLVKTMRYLQNVETVVNGGKSAELDLFTLLKPLGFTSRQIEAIADGKWKMGRGTGGNESPLGTLSVRTYPKTACFKPSKEPYLVTLDADKVATPLVLRYVKQGDKFKPFGMKGCSKLVSDFLTDLKVDSFERHSQPVVCDAEGEIMWLVGHRVSHKAACTENTINILELRYSNI
jgi:tRNA(Ile)-lysidine synthetase-like protein